MAVAGDLVPTRSNAAHFISGAAGGALDAKLLALLMEADARAINLEAPLYDGSSPILKAGPALSAPTACAKGLAALRPVLALSNNHILDHGPAGLKSTLGALREAGITWFGAGETLEEAAKPFVLEKNGMRIGIAAVCEREFSVAGEASPGANPFDPLETPDQVARLKKECDFVVALYHGGIECYRYPSPGLRKTLRKLAEAEKEALASGKSRRDAILAANDRFYRGDIAREFVRGSREIGGLHTLEDLANWTVHIEEPVQTTYKGIAVYKLDLWTQGPAMLQALNILEGMDLKAMGYNSARYLHAIYQAMNLAFADRDFYYGDPYFPPDEPKKGLLSKEYAKARAAKIDWTKNDPNVKPGDPYPFQGRKNPFADLLEKWPPPSPKSRAESATSEGENLRFHDDFYAGTTSVEAADAEGWVVSVTPSGGWLPAAIAGKTGIGMSQRMQSFVLDRAENPFNVVEPGKHPRVTLTPTLALKDGRPYLSFGVQGGDSQDQNLLQFFLNVVEFGMTPQEAAEAANINSYQMRSSFGDHESRPGAMMIHPSLPPWVRSELVRMGYKLEVVAKTSGPINAILLDQAHGTMWGGSSDHGEDYGIGW
jgi:gamma-glutamyltranspeptidase